MKLKILASFLVIGIFSIFVFADVKIEDLDFLAPRVTDTASVPPTEAGLIVYDTSEANFKGRQEGGGFISLGVPVGTILSFAGTIAPDGFLLCDGNQVSRATYVALFSVIGTNFGSGDGSATFHLPDLRGRFLRGVDSGAGNDPDATSRVASNSGGTTGDSVGSYQVDAMQGHKHNQRGYANSGQSDWPNGWGYQTRQISNLETGSPISDGTNGTPRTASETRPQNIAVNYIIKI